MIIITIITGDAEPDSGYGTLLNYSLVQNVTCTGSEVSLSQCNVYDAQDDCLPWCPDRNIGLRCFTPAGMCLPPTHF